MKKHTNKSHLHENAVALVVISSEKPRKFLLLKYAIHGQKHWDFVKGRVEKGEEIRDAAKRELEEETGIQGGKLKFSLNFEEKYEYQYKKHSGEEVHKKVTYIGAELSKKHKILLSEEHSGYRWLELGDAISILSFNNQKDILNKFSLLK